MEPRDSLPSPLFAQALELNVNNRDCVLTFYRWELPYTLLDPANKEATHVPVARIHLPHSTSRELRDLLTEALEKLDESGRPAEETRDDGNAHG